MAATKTKTKPPKQVQVETFECYETAAEPIEATEEAVSLIEQLGLEGQSSMINRERDRPTRSPFRKMTVDEVAVYSTLCPSVVKLADYKASPIPLRVLQIAKLAQDSGQFTELVVWDRESELVHDPVLVGRLNTDPRYSWMFDNYILARWADHLDAFVTMRTQAVKAIRQKRLAELEKVRRKVASSCEIMKTVSEGELLAQFSQAFSFSHPQFAYDH